MAQVEISDAQADLRGLIERARTGEEVGLSEGGQVVARIVAVAPAEQRWPVTLGRLDGQFTIPDDFDAPLPDDLLDLFEGRA